jgi:hypothetical protein
MQILLCILNWLRSAFPSDTVGNKQKIYRYIPIEIKKDLKWWYECLVLRETTIVSNSKQLICTFCSVIKGGKIA